MRSDHSPESQKVAPDFSSLEELQSYFGKQLLTSIFNLNVALDAAFADKKHDHPSQLIYRAIWSKLHDIFDSRKRSESPEKLDKQFHFLRTKHASLTNQYFINHKSEIVKNIPLIKNMGIKNIDTYVFDLKKYYESLSLRKLELLETLINAADALARVKYILGHDLSHDINESIHAVGSSLTDQCTASLEYVDQELKADYVTVNNVESQSTAIDLFFADAKDENQLRQQLNDFFPSRKADIEKIVGCQYGKFERSAHVLEDAFGLMSKIEKYKRMYSKIEEDILSNQINESEITKVIEKFCNERSSLIAEIESVGELAYKRDIFLKKLGDESKEYADRHYQLTPISDEQLQQIPMVKEFNHRRAKLNSLDEELLKVEETITELVHRDQKLENLLKQDVEKSLRVYIEECCACVDKAVVQVDLMSRLSKEQTASNVLWEKDVPASLASINRIVNQLKATLRNQRLFDKLSSRQAVINNECIRHNINFNYSLCNKAESKYVFILNSKDQLTKQEESTRGLLKQIEAREFEKECELAKTEYIKQLEQLRVKVESFSLAQLKLAVKKVILPDPNVLQKLFTQQQGVNDNQRSSQKPESIDSNMPAKRIEQPSIPEGFFRRHWKVIVGSVSSFSLAGLGIGLGIGLGGAAASLGVGALLVPVLAVTGLIVGAVAGFAAGCVGGCLADKRHEKPFVAPVASVTHAPEVTTTQFVNQALQHHSPLPVSVMVPPVANEMTSKMTVDQGSSHQPRSAPVQAVVVQNNVSDSQFGFNKH